jgi:hypothetical protein
MMFSTKEREREEFKPLPSIHVFHTNRYIASIHKSTIKADNMFRVTIVHKLKFSHDLLSHIHIGIHMNNLK